MKVIPLKVEVPDVGLVSALWQTPPRPLASLVLAHGAGAGMTHRSLAAIADGLADLGVATLRYQFPYMEKGSRRPDGPAVAQATVRAAVTEARRQGERLPLFAGGRSFGGRMTSQAQALEPLEGVAGLVFFAFPLHPAGKPSVTRAEHLSAVTIPMLFLQGSNDALADIDLLQRTIKGLEGRATLDLIADADHAFHVPAKTGRKDPEVLALALATTVRWMTTVSNSTAPSRAEPSQRPTDQAFAGATWEPSA
jgi:predicted alpha/beta-hydrolase family hydrolase